MMRLKLHRHLTCATVPASPPRCIPDVWQLIHSSAPDERRRTQEPAACKTSHGALLTPPPTPTPVPLPLTWKWEILLSPSLHLLFSSVFSFTWGETHHCAVLWPLRHTTSHIPEHVVRLLLHDKAPLHPQDETTTTECLYRPQHFTHFLFLNTLFYIFYSWMKRFKAG